MKMKNCLKIIVVCLVGATMCLAFTGCKKSFNITKTMEVTFEGCDGYGECVLENEYDWVNDVTGWYGKSINEKQRKEMERELRKTVTYEISPSEGLSNGDEVTITANVDSAAEGYAFNLKSKEIKVVVKDLKEVELIDPFEGVTVSFNGMAPDGNAVVETKNKIPDVSFELSENSGLSNGDTITLTAVPFGGMNEYAKKYGQAFISTEETYTVEGLLAYASSLDEISDESMEKLKKQANDSIVADCASKFKEDVKQKSADFKGCYFLSEKDGVDVRPNNRIYIVYEVTTDVTGYKKGGDGKTKETTTETYYTYYELEDIMIMPDGTCSFDLNDGKLCNNSIKSQYGYYDGLFGATFYNYKGYSDLDSMFNKCVANNLGYYDYETTV